MFYPTGHTQHVQANHPERPERVETIKKRLKNAGIWQETAFLEPTAIDPSLLTRVHDAEYLKQLVTASQSGQHFDLDTYLTEASWELALKAAGGATTIARSVWEGNTLRGFALTRPPGHHATRYSAMGFCLLNNIAIAAEDLIQNYAARKIAIIDLDVHHGNGSQDIFWHRNDVFFVSIHQKPLYPGTGMIEETGEGEGNGFTLNIPLPPNSGDQARLAHLREVVLPMLLKFEPEMLLVSVGFDAHWRDPLAQQLASCDNYGELTSELCSFADQHCQGKIAFFLEGGYDLTAGAESALAMVQAMKGQTWSDSLGPSPQLELNHWEETLAEIKKFWNLS